MTETTAGAVALEGQPFGTGFSRSLGIVLTEAGPQRTRGWAELGPQHHQESGIVHGGWYAAVAETMASIGASLAVVDRGETVVGVSNTTEFFRPQRSGRLEIDSSPVHQGRTQQVWEVRITRPADGRLVARGQVRLQHIAASGQGATRE
jgi:1,4-dihydroxy-2-naphthoyl-CoA hydrolase